MSSPNSNAPLPEGWRLARLGEVAEVVGGSTPSRENPDFWEGNIPWVVPSEITELSGRYIRSTRDSITESGRASAGLRIIPAGSVLLTTRATIGATAINTVPVTTNQGFQNLIPLEGSDKLWLYNLIAECKLELEKRSAGSTFKEVSRDSIRSLPIPLPPLAEQRAIAAVLDSMDDAIESSREVIAATEGLRDSMRQELLTRGMPGWHTEWREQHGIGSIPEDWRVVKLGEVAEVRFSSVDKKTTEGELPVLLCNYTDVFYNPRICAAMDFMRATATTSELKHWSLRQGDVLFTKDSETPEEIGVPAYVSEDLPEVLCGYHLGLARPVQKQVIGVYLVRVMSSQSAARELGRIANGITRFGLTLDATRNLSIPLPPLPEQQAIAETLDSIDDTIEARRAELRELEGAKASTAEALLTGRVRVGGSLAADYG